VVLVSSACDANSSKGFNLKFPMIVGDRCEQDILKAVFRATLSPFQFKQLGILLCSCESRDAVLTCPDQSSHIG